MGFIRIGRDEDITRACRVAGAHVGLGASLPLFAVVVICAFTATSARAELPPWASSSQAGPRVQAIDLQPKAPDFSRGGVFHRKIVTSDGVPLALYRYVPAGGGSLHPPVLLVAELGFTREVFDHGGFGLAPFLREHGRDVFVLEPRGHGASGAPKDWRIEDVALRDLPAAIGAIHAARVASGVADPKERIDVVAHGFTGTLVEALAADELAGELRRVVTLCSPAIAEVPNAHVERVLATGGAFSGLPLDPAGTREFDLIFALHGKFEHGRLEGLRPNVVGDLSSTAAKELLQWMRSGDFALPDGTTVRGRLARYALPTFAVLAARDNYVHPEHGAPIRELAKNAKVAVNLLSKIQAFNEDYTHLSVLQGDAAPIEVFPLIETFLAGEGPAPVHEVNTVGKPEQKGAAQ